MHGTGFKARVTLTLLTSLALAGAGQGIHAQEPEPFPAKAKTPRELAPKPWRIESSAIGDLNKDGRPDAALIVSSGAEGANAQRKLIIAFKRKDGLFEKIIENDTATISGGTAAASPQVSIKKGVVSLSQSWGGRQHHESTHKYQYRDGHWMLIGYTITSAEETDPAGRRSLDINLLTGDVSASVGTGTGAQHERFRELWAARIDGAEPTPSDWCPHTVQMPIPGSEDHKIVTLQAVHSNSKLFIRAQVEGGKPLGAGDVIMTDAEGNKIAPESSRATIYGYLINEYDLTQGPLKDAVGKFNTASSNEKLFRANITVHPRADGKKLTMSTGGKRPAAIFLSERKGAVELKDIDMRQGSLLHPLINPM